MKKSVNEFCLDGLNNYLGDSGKGFCQDGSKYGAYLGDSQILKKSVNELSLVVLNMKPTSETSQILKKSVNEFCLDGLNNYLGDSGKGFCQDGSKYGAYLGDSQILKKSGNELSLGDFVSWFYFGDLKCGFWLDNSQCDTYLGNSTGMWLYLGDLESWVYFGDLKCGFYQEDSWGSKPIDVVLCWMVLDESNIKKVLGRKCRKVLTPPFYFIKPESLKRQNWKKRKKH